MYRFFYRWQSLRWNVYTSDDPIGALIAAITWLKKGYTIKMHPSLMKALNDEETVARMLYHTEWKKDAR